MPRSKKIRKKKSFMFTTRHQSENGILSLCSGIISLGAFITCVIISYNNRGEVATRIGAVCMFAFLCNIIGLIAGLLSLKERDIFVWVPRSGIILNGLLIITWVIILLM